MYEARFVVDILESLLKLGPHKSLLQYHVAQPLGINSNKNIGLIEMYPDSWDLEKLIGSERRSWYGLMKKVSVFSKKKLSVQ